MLRAKGIDEKTLFHGELHVQDLQLSIPHAVGNELHKDLSVWAYLELAESYKGKS